MAHQKKLMDLQFSTFRAAAKWFTGGVFALLFASCGPGEIAIETVADWEAYLEEEMELQQIPALSVLMFKEGEVRYEQHLGEADLEEGEPLGDSDLFLLASVSKVVTAVALLQLHEEGYFELDAPVSTFLPFQLSVPGYSTPVTFRMLLTHTSGIADGAALDGQYYYGVDSPVALGSFLEEYLVPGGQFYDAADNFYDFEPGTAHAYSNIGSALIGYLVERISGQDFNAYCKQHIFQPLGMSNTYWSLEEALQSGNRLVKPYRSEGRRLLPVEHYTFTDYPNGGLRSTANDLWAFLRALIGDQEAAEARLLRPEIAKLMWRPQLPAIDEEVGLHMFLLHRSHQLWGHDGGEEGVATIMAFNPETKAGAILLANQGDADLDELLEEAYELARKW